MATTKIWAVHSRLDHLVGYVSNTNKTNNPNFDLKSVIEYAGDSHKTEQRFFVSGVNCQPETAYKSMSNSLKLNDKKIKVLAYHAYQSFAKGEVTAEVAHEIGLKMANELWGERVQVVVATHLNTDHYHNHFVLCSTSFIDGKRFHSCKESYAKIREASDRLCREYRLSVIENPCRGKSKHYAECKAERQNQPTWRSIIKAEVDEAITQSTHPYNLILNLKKRGYEVKHNQYRNISVRPPGKERFFRLERNFGVEYSYEGLMRQMINRRPVFPETPTKPKITKYKLRGDINKTIKLTGFKALYFHYLYLMGKIPRSQNINPRPKSKVHFLYREDWRYIDKISAEVRLLFRCNINTSEELSAHKTKLTERMEVLTTERADLRKELRKTKDEPTKIELKSKIAILSQGLGELRKEVSLCDDIADRTVKIHEKRNQMREIYQRETGGKGSRDDRNQRNH